MASASSIQTDGQSYLPALMGRDGREHDWVFIRGGRRMRGVVIDRNGWKLCELKDGSRQLYSLREDYEERRDVAAEHPEVVARLRAIFEAQIDSERP